MTAVHGTADPRFAGVRDAFAGVLGTHRDQGAAFAAWHGGTPVVDLWGGRASAPGSPERPWRSDTLVTIFSGTKALVAAVVLVLVDRGVLALEDRVADHWPAFGAEGKGAITVGELLDHTAGLPYLAVEAGADLLEDPERAAALLAAQAPLWPGERRVAYHAVTYGWLLWGLLVAATGRTPGALLRELVAGPLDLDAWIGLPAAAESRVAELTIDDVFRRTYAAELRDPTQRLLNGRPPLYDEPLPWNRPEVHAAEVPAVGALVTPRAVARLFACLVGGGTLDGRRIATPEAVTRALAPRSAGVDPLTGEEHAFAAGFQLQTADRTLGPPADAFGHAGAGGSVHGAWPALGVAFSYATNDLRDAADDARASTLLTALHDAAACA